MMILGTISSSSDATSPAMFAGSLVEVRDGEPLRADPGGAPGRRLRQATPQK
jgi:hypothetical protein